MATKCAKKHSFRSFVAYLNCNRSKGTPEYPHEASTAGKFGRGKNPSPQRAGGERRAALPWPPETPARGHEKSRALALCGDAGLRFCAFSFAGLAYFTASLRAAPALNLITFFAAI